MSGQHQARSKSSPKQGPLRATMPIASLTKEGSGLRDAVDHDGAPLTGSRTRSAEGLVDQRGPSSEEGKSKSCNSNSNMRRTASLDAMYLKGLFPREGASVNQDKTTQTDTSGSVDPLHLRISSETTEEKLNRLVIRPRRKSCNEIISAADQGAPEEKSVHASSQTCTFVSNSPDQRRALDSASHPRASKSTSPQSKAIRSSRDDAVSKSTSTSPNSKNLSGAGPKSSRSSEEGLNQEIENLILRPLVDPNSVRMPTPEGRKAPVADLFRIANRPSPTMQSMGGQHSSEDSQGSSPDQERMASGPSPHINRFSSRAPPDGCETTVKPVPIIRPIPKLLTQPQFFTLAPSSESAFEGPNSSSSSSRDEQEKDLPKVPDKDVLE